MHQWLSDPSTLTQTAAAADVFFGCLSDTGLVHAAMEMHTC